MLEKQNRIPDQSITKDDELLYHYVDSFRSNYKSQGTEYDIISIGKIFFTSGPKWADYLMSLRDKIVGVFGLKTASTLTAEQKSVDNYKFEPGEQLGIFKLYVRTENELVMGEDDKHLSFRFSILHDCINDNITLTTMVEFKNIFGRLYFMPVKPFHQLIVKRTLKDMIRTIENENTGSK
jgi:hypothetical protein